MYLVWGPGGVSLDVPPALEARIVVGWLLVVLGNDDGVAEHPPVVVAEVVLPEPVPSAPG